MVLTTVLILRWVSQAPTIHSDAETGPGAVLEDYFKDGNLTVEKDWDYVKQSW